MKEKLKKAHIIHKGSFMNIHEDDVLLPNNKDGKRLYIRHPGGSGVLAITPDEKVILVKQYRYATGKYLVEIPAGKHDSNDDPLVTAKRELIEETGYTSDDYTYLTAIHPTPGYSDEVITIYRAKNCYQSPLKLRGDDDEFIEVLLYDKAKVRSIMTAGLLSDSKTLIALQYFINM